MHHLPVMRGRALITGCSSGFGLLTAVELAKAGFEVVATMRNLDRREALDEALMGAGAAAVVRQLDVTDVGSIATCAEASEPIDILVNNAGFGIGGFVYDLTLEEIREQFETNFFGVVAMVKALLPGMVERRRGRIINVSSGNGLFAPPAMAAYSASKFALEGFSEALRTELQPFGIEVVLIEPGMFKTPIFERNRRVAKAAKSEDSPFYKMSRRMEQLVEGMLASCRQEPVWVAEAIVRAAKQRHPPLRATVGRDAFSVALVKRFLPYGVLERLIARKTRLKHEMQPAG